MESKKESLKSMSSATSGGSPKKEKKRYGQKDTVEKEIKAVQIELNANEQI